MAKLPVALAGTAISTACLLLLRHGRTSPVALVGAAAIGAIAGAAIVTAINVTRDSQSIVGNHLPLHQALTLLSNPTRPWLYGVFRDTSYAAKQVSTERYDGHNVNNNGDAFRHTYWSALTKLRLINDHHLNADQADRIVMAMGLAHEQDTPAELTNGQSEMDMRNDQAGLALVPDSLTQMPDSQVAERVQTVLDRGGLTIINDAGVLVPSNATRH